MLATVPGSVAASGPGQPLRYRLEIERGLPLDGPAVAAQVHRVLTDPRGWQPIENIAFARVDGPADFELIIASPDMVDRLCYPLDTIGQLSCRNIAHRANEMNDRLINLLCSTSKSARI